MSNVTEIAMTIIAQFGGRSFAKAIGLREPILVHSNPEKCEVTAIFHWRTESKGGFNTLSVTLVEALDTYRLVFGKAVGRGTIHNTPINDVYCDQLCDIFTFETGIPLIAPEWRHCLHLP